MKFSRFSIFRAYICMSKISSQSIDDIRYDIENLRFDDESSVYSTLNIHSLILCTQNHKFARSIATADQLVCDGYWLAIFVKILFPNKKIFHITGRDLLSILTSNCKNNRAKKLHFVGGETDTLKVLWEYSDLHKKHWLVDQLPFYFEINRELVQAAIEELPICVQSNVILGIGAPKQEIFAKHLSRLLPAINIFCVGAATKFLAGTERVSPVIVRRMGLEWVWRLFLSKGATWKRVFISGPLFLVIFVFCYFCIKKDTE
jgi:N-acetylglucosaminyldiphosphoundecaprenol N-acetyl-beta-D-mannosaminyltransferase